MKETTHFVKNIFESFNELSAEQKSELIELLDLNPSRIVSLDEKSVK